MISLRLLFSFVYLVDLNWYPWFKGHTEWLLSLGLRIRILVLWNKGIILFALFRCKALSEELFYISRDVLNKCSGIRWSNWICREWLGLYLKILHSLTVWRLICLFFNNFLFSKSFVWWLFIRVHFIKFKISWRLLYLSLLFLLCFLYLFFFFFLYGVKPAMSKKHKYVSSLSWVKGKAWVKKFFCIWRKMVRKWRGLSLWPNMIHSCLWACNLFPRWMTCCHFNYCAS